MDQDRLHRAARGDPARLRRRLGLAKLPLVFRHSPHFGRLLFGLRVTDLAGYMFDARKPRFVRALSLFHVVLPGVLIWMLHELGYDSRALAGQTLLAWIVLPITYAVTRPSDENINWVRVPDRIQRRVHPLVWLAFLMLAFPIGLYLPTHFALRALFALHG
jgi:hypothetical protein